MKKKIALLLSGVLMAGVVSVSAADEYPEVNLLIEGQAAELDQPAIIYNSRTMVPMRAVAENLGAEVNWDNDNKIAEFFDGETKVYVSVGSNSLKIVKNGGESTADIDTPAIIVNGRTLVPIAFLTEYFGYDVTWDAETKTVDVTKSVGEKDPNVATEDDIVTVDFADILAAFEEAEKEK